MFTKLKSRVYRILIDPLVITEEIYHAIYGKHNEHFFFLFFKEALYEQGEKLFEAIVRVRLISLIHLNTLVQSAL